MFCTELKQLLKFSTGAEEHPPCVVILLNSSHQNESIYASNCLCKIIVPQGMASLEYEYFRIVFSEAINGNSFNCVIVILAMIVFRRYFSYVLSNIILILMLLLLMLQVITLKMEDSTTMAPACLAKLQV